MIEKTEKITANLIIDMFIKDRRFFEKIINQLVEKISEEYNDVISENREALEDELKSNDELTATKKSALNFFEVAVKTHLQNAITHTLKETPLVR